MRHEIALSPGVLLLALMTAGPPSAAAQNDSAVTTTTTAHRDNDRGFSWGLLGRLGLLGLIPRGRKEVHAHETPPVRPAPPREPPPPPSRDVPPTRV
ncbi:MAG TPA: WGxxGxxG family protein [Longimicrobiaceae bacterium]